MFIEPIHHHLLMMSTSSVSGKMLHRKKGVQYVKSGEYGGLSSNLYS